MRERTGLGTGFIRERGGWVWGLLLVGVVEGWDQIVVLLSWGFLKMLYLVKLKLISLIPWRVP